MLQLHSLNCHQPECSQGKETKLLLALERVWQRWVIGLKTSNDPKIWQTVDRLGNTWWHAYNPSIGCSATRESATEILEWIERRVCNE